ncbi:MAG: hypothetical protein ABI587_15390 [Gemmatimonadales bacterium]
MSMSGVSRHSGQTQPNAVSGDWHARRNAREQLTQALEAGDLDGAKAAWQKLKEFGGGRMFRRFQGDPGATATLKNDFSAIGTSLRAGNMDNAKAAFGVLQEHLQMFRDAHEAPEGGGVSADVMPQPGMSISMTLTYVSVSFSYASSSASTTGTQLNVAG